MERNLNSDSPAWLAFVWISFAASMILMCCGIYFLPVDVWIKGYMGMGLFFTVGSSFSLSKTVRDQHESSRLINRLSEAKTEKLLHEFESKSQSKIV